MFIGIHQSDGTYPAQVCVPPYMLSVRVHARDDLLYHKKSSFPFPACVCVCVIMIQAVCSPSVIKSNRPSSLSESTSKTTAVIDRCRGCCMSTQTHKNPHSLELSVTVRRKQHGCESDLSSACIMHSSMCTLASAKEREGTSSTLRE